LTLGEVNRAAPHNLKGNNENPRFWAVHDAVLARVGAAWHRPPTEPVAWTSTELAALRAVLSDYAGLARPWGFKDPRATVLLDGWFEVLPDLRLIGSIRHPTAVAASLAKRNGYDAETATEIWAGYNRAMLAWHERTPFAIVDYDAPDYEIRVRRAAGALGLDVSRPMPFRSRDLTHQTATGAPPAGVADLWSRLRDIAA